ncbi:MAG: 3-hydroxyacyl-CoA dehydrogenase NAD-binding domain-containing protein [Cyclobacteriaceae bacterium]|nr:3-hydroxyacyl-CoA dehydrogenase NAD-binding domain-containing protein [Cyclobacteriaceae bacterium]
MTLDSVKIIGVVGAGTMGLGIAQIAALAGYNTLLYDVNNEMLEKAIQIIDENLEKGILKGKITKEQKTDTLDRITVIDDINGLIADIVIEAIAERLDVKQQVFAQLEKINSSNTILATNTSSIPITQIACKLQHPNRFVGMHFFNPAHIMKLVEVISGVDTDFSVAELIKKLAIKLGKTPVMANDSPGFIVNRVARHFYLEGLKLVEEGVADFESIDRLVQSTGFKMGPFQLMDLIGVDTNYSVTTSMFNAFQQEAKFRPNRIQKQKVDAGHIGRKSGKGFYSYESNA